VPWQSQPLYGQSVMPVRRREHLWLQLASVHNQAILPLPASNLETPSVSRHPLKLA